MFVLSVVGSQKVWLLGRTPWHKLHTRFHTNTSTFSRVNHADGQTGRLTLSTLVASTSWHHAKTAQKCLTKTELTADFKWRRKPPCWSLSHVKVNTLLPPASTHVCFKCPRQDLTPPSCHTWYRHWHCYINKLQIQRFSFVTSLCPLHTNCAIFLLVLCSCYTKFRCLTPQSSRWHATDPLQPNSHPHKLFRSRKF